MQSSASNPPKSMLERAEIPALVLIVLLFWGIAAIRLDVLPIPWQDEPWLMQPAHELLTQGHLGLPMFRNRGNHLETKVFDAPVFYLESALWYRLFGFSLTSARAFNLGLAGLALALVFAFARRTQGAVGALAAVAFLATEANYFDIARMIRNDFTVLVHAWIAFNLFLWAERAPVPETPRFKWLDFRFVLAGIGAGLAVQSHLNGLYVFGVFGLWLLLRDGWKLWRSTAAWSIALGVMLSLIPFGLYAASDWTSFVGQWRGTPGRYAALQGGLFDNVLHEWRRYYAWGVTILNYGGAQTRLFLTWLLIAAALLFGLVRAVLFFKVRTSALSPQSATLSSKFWFRSLATTFFIIVFFTILDEPKSPNYIPHLMAWFAVCLGEMVTGLLEFGKESVQWRRMGQVLAGLLAVYALWTGLVFARYLRWTQSFQPAPYHELAAALREAVPPDIVPVGYPTHWLAFTDKPTYLACKSRFWRKLPGRDFVFIVDEKGIASNSRKFPKWLKENSPQFTILAELENTLYGKITVYYTGTNPRWQGQPILRYRFNGRNAGFEKLPSRKPEPVTKNPEKVPATPDNSAAEDENSGDDE
ncbi:MAG: glycosyltransferase family 39 protein [Blastocatellia bacterium]|nr:glycosyltransferase family 39 protein [Blastocatellia bacterium]